MRPAALARIGATAVFFAVVGFVGMLALSMSIPVLFGYQSLTMLTGSMGDAIPTGSVVIDETIKPLQARPGDVLTFVDPDYPDRLLTHRLRSVKVENNLVVMTTRGDANDTDETWSIAPDGTVGRVAYVVPMVGHARAWVSRNAGRATVFVVLGVVGAWTLIDVWLPMPLSHLLRQRPGSHRRRAAAATPTVGSPSAARLVPAPSVAAPSVSVAPAAGAVPPQALSASRSA